MRGLARLLCAVLLAGGLAACSGDGGEGGAATAGPGTLDVWVMRDSAPDDLIERVNAEVEAAHPGLTVRVQVLDWEGRDVKWKTALAGDDPPDVLEMGNTDVLTYAASGALAELKPADYENSGTWLKGLADAGGYEGKLYGVPYYGGTRVVIYRKDLFEKAGIDSEPATLAELRQAAEKLMKANPGEDFSGLYFPGRYQYGALPFVFDAGGQIAAKEGTAWKGMLSTPQSQQGLRNWADLVKAVSKAPLDVDTDADRFVDALGQGHTGMIIGQAWMMRGLGEKYPKLADQLGAFPVPGVNGTMPVFIGGSNLVVSAGSQAPAIATEWVKLITGTKYQTELARSGLLPNSTSLEGVVEGVTAVQMKAAARSWFTPQSTQWSNVDNAQVLQDMFQAIASGEKSVAEAAATADKKIAEILNATG
ncbi:N,N'-diacetylchitobiose transport system substrate-binding protein [Thermocatellispora tengchongensis]|uniref:N,N'-diacetylchitobiose transport system substrate-binding protein n=1 Tax=Thermocatellispora tengchongensis TaxID=1073253 RepID=A0A840P818_9ACTN|nr:extracellular solute-binding protein [Thermocatellispora tengchongensis]MBB5135139.1 N,N'-diacetylchitobiose transport system substrate-binding protein [Thermocatellispora tengchongensis]